MQGSMQGKSSDPDPLATGCMIIKMFGDLFENVIC